MTTAWAFPVTSPDMPPEEPSTFIFVAVCSAADEALEAIKASGKAAPDDVIGDPYPISSATVDALGLASGQVMML